MNVTRSNIDKKVRVTNLYPSTLSSHIGFEKLNKIDVNYISEIIRWLITQPKEIEIREMSIYCTTLEKEFKVDKLL
jgi:NADP-dependent 3-hydroxy acid dehydrogenase YdfG